MNITITFTHNEKTYQGTLYQVAGAGSAMFHMMINSFYQGCLIKTDNGWQFSTQKDGVIIGLGLYFGQEVEKVIKLIC